MKPLKHIILGFIFSLILYFIFPKIKLIEFSLIFLSSFLIDVDHYLYYVYKKRNLNLKKAYKWFIQKRDKLLTLPKKKRAEYKSSFLFLHGIEFLIILGLLSLISEIFFFIFLGIAFHLILDIPEVYYRFNRADKISIFWDYFKFKNLKKL